MKVGVAGATRTGRAIDLRELCVARDCDISPTAVAEAVRGDGAVASDRAVAAKGEAAAPADAVVVECPDPSSVHDHVGEIRAGVALSLRPALAAAARSRGHAAPQADELAAVRDRLDALDVPETDLRRARRRVADASDAEEQLRERVASLRGRVQALREVEADASERAERELADATRRLSSVETDRIAAEQALARARERAAADRETRRERLRLQDRAGNLCRAARESLASEVRDDFEAARAGVPASGLGESVESDSEGSVESALAVARVAEMDAPVVLAREASPFDGVAEAAEWLDGPVLGV